MHDDVHGNGGYGRLVMALQWFFPTDVNHFTVTEGSSTRKVIEFLFSANDPGIADVDSVYRWPCGGKINRNWGGWGEHGEDRYMQQVWFLNKGAIYWNVGGTTWTGSTAADVSWDYTAGTFGGSDAGGGHVLHTDFASDGSNASTPAYLVMGVSSSRMNFCNLSYGTSDGYGGAGSQGPYPGDATEHYQWYPANHTYVKNWVDTWYDHVWKDYAYTWYCGLYTVPNATDNDQLAPIQLKDAAGARYSIPSYDAGVDAEDAIENSNPTNCLDLIDASTDPMTDVNPRFDTKYDGAGQGEHDGVVYFQMPEWEGGMWADQQWTKEDISSITKSGSGTYKYILIYPKDDSVRNLVHEAFTAPGPPTGYMASHEAASAGGRARTLFRFLVYYGASDTYAYYYGRWFVDFNDGNPGDSTETDYAGGAGNDLNEAFEKDGWFMMYHESGANEGGVARWQSGTYNADGTRNVGSYDTGDVYHAVGIGSTDSSNSRHNPNEWANLIGHHAYYFNQSSSSASHFHVGISMNHGISGSYLKYSMTGLPTGLSFDPENRVIHGVLPTASASANTTVTYTATDFWNQSTSITFTLTAVGYSDPNHKDAAAAAAASAAAANVDRLQAEADLYAAQQAAAAAMVIQGSGIRRTRDLSTDLVAPDKYLEVDLLTSDDQRAIPNAADIAVEEMSDGN